MKSGYATYGKAQVNTADPRDVEYRVLAKATAQLQDAMNSTDPLAIKERISAALYNAKVWSTLRNDLSSEHNNLPKELRASLVSVSIWIEKETDAVLKDKGDIESLVYINRQIMAGLKPDSESNEEPSL